MAINKCRVSESNASLTAVRIGFHHAIIAELHITYYKPSVFISFGASTTHLPCYAISLLLWPCVSAQVMILRMAIMFLFDMHTSSVSQEGRWLCKFFSQIDDDDDLEDDYILPLNYHKVVKSIFWDWIVGGFNKLKLMIWKIQLYWVEFKVSQSDHGTTTAFEWSCFEFFDG